MRARWLQLSAAGLAVLLIVWFARRNADARTEPVGAAGSALVERRVFASTVAAIGTVKPQIGAEVKVGSRISGRVRRLAANVGHVVRRGQVIAELETEELDALVAERRADLEVAEATVVAAAATVQLSAAELARQEQLERQAIATRAEAEVARERHGVAVAAHAASTAAIARARAALTQTTVQRSFAVLHAPIGGVVASVATHEGRNPSRAPRPLSTKYTAPAGSISSQESNGQEC